MTWKSSDEKIATVNSKGKVTPKSNGTVTITATNTYGKKSACTVNVVTAKPPIATVDDISINYINYSYYSNGLLKYADINWSTSFSGASKGSPNIEYTLRLDTIDYQYSLDSTLTPITKTVTVSPGKNYSTTTRVYCIYYGGDTKNAPTFFRVSAQEKSASARLPFRAGNFTPGGYYTTD